MISKCKHQTAGQYMQECAYFIDTSVPKSVLNKLLDHIKRQDYDFQGFTITNTPSLQPRRISVTTIHPNTQNPIISDMFNEGWHIVRNSLTLEDWILITQFGRHLKPNMLSLVECVSKYTHNHKFVELSLITLEPTYTRMVSDNLTMRSIQL